MRRPGNCGWLRTRCEHGGDGSREKVWPEWAGSPRVGAARRGWPPRSKMRWSTTRCMSVPMTGPPSGAPGRWPTGMGSARTRWLGSGASTICGLGRSTTFKVSDDPDFEAKLVDVVGMYLDPPAKAAVFSFDEKTQVQALDRTQPSLPMKKGRSGTMTFGLGSLPRRAPPGRGNARAAIRRVRRCRAAHPKRDRVRVNRRRSGRRRTPPRAPQSRRRSSRRAARSSRRRPVRPRSSPLRRAVRGRARSARAASRCRGTPDRGL